MIGSDVSPPRLTSVISGVLIDGRISELFVMSAVGKFKENEHASFSLYVSSPTRPSDFGIMPGQRIEFDFGTIGNTMKFQGYISAVIPHHRLTEDHVIDEQEIQCLGESMVLKSNRPRFFTEMTCTQAIDRIVSDSNLGFSDEFHRDETVWRTLAQTDQTDWEMIVHLALRIGAHVVCTRGVVRLLDYTDIMSRLLPTRTYTQQSAIPMQTVNMEPPEGLLLDFTPLNQSTIDPIYTASSLAYMVNGKAVVLTAPPEHTGRFSVTNFAAKMPARTVQEAEALQSGLYIPDWVQEASVRVMGDATVTPATNIKIVSRAGSPDFDGVWYVKEVSHSLIAKNYTTTMIVGRVEQRAVNWKADFPFWLGDKRGVPSLYASGTGQWLSTWRQGL